MENFTYTGAKVFVLLRANCPTNCYYDFNPWVFLRNDVIFSNFQPRIGTRKINGGAKFSEIKVQKTRVVMSVIERDLAR